MRRPFHIAVDAYWHFLADDGWAIASHIALSALMAMFPFFIVLTSLAGVFGSNDLADEVAKLMLATWPEEAAVPIAREIHDVLTTTHTGALTVGALFAIFFASSGVESLRIGLNRAYGMVDEPLEGTFTFFRFAISVVVLTVALFVAHKWLPAGRRRVVDILPGIVATLALWLIAGIAFGRYLAEFAITYVSYYAGLASAMIALVFLYWTASIFVYGGAINSAMRPRATAAAATADT
ncbi:MAG: YihY/virulence factor BrkB family protein [Alphaproteobacteria bacterium]|nr:MAG: YihY/virulence factor BrkB family protein [Alphaproteobacteria bacterium]